MHTHPSSEKILKIIGIFPKHVTILNVHVHYEHTFLALLLSEIITFVTFKIQTINATWTLKMSVRGEEEIVTKSCKRHAEKRFIFIQTEQQNLSRRWEIKCPRGKNRSLLFSSRHGLNKSLFVALELVKTTCLYVYITMLKCGFLDVIIAVVRKAIYISQM